MLSRNFNDCQSEEELVRLIRFDNNNEALIILLSLYKPFIISRIRCFNFDKCDFEDVYQECVIVLYRTIFDYNSEKSSFRTFASLCINRILISLMRSKYNKSTIPQEAIVDLDESVLGADNSTPESIVEHFDNYEGLLNRVRRQLSNREYEVLMQLSEGLSYAEIAEKLSMSPKAVDNTVQRIRKKFSNLK